MKTRTSANQIIIGATMLSGIVDLYAADTSWAKAIRGSADDSVKQFSLVGGLMAYKPLTLVFNK